MNEKVVVIGGSGFLGSHVADCLSDSDYKVTIFDAKPSKWLRDDQEMVLGEISDETKLKQSIKGAKYVYHLAGVADIGQAQISPVHTIEQNIIGSAKVIEASIEANVERFVFASTVYVYSNQGSFYRVSKQAIEALIEAYKEKYDFEYTILRYGSLYGPRAQEWNGIKKFINRALNDNHFIHAGTGEEKREYIHIKDAARLSVNALKKKYANCSLILTGVQTLTSKELLTMISEILGGKLTIEYKPENRDSVHYSITPYRFTPKVANKMIPEEFIDIGQGILEMIEEIYLKKMGTSEQPDKDE